MTPQRPSKVDYVYNIADIFIILLNATLKDCDFPNE